jgi:GntR family transcriptional repressor for pyruvate dehydrogenase complex
VSVSESFEPMGAWNLKRVFGKKGVRISEATCGRLLRTLEDAGYVESDGRKGRKITSKGKKVLEDWRFRQVRDKSQIAFAQSLQIHDADELRDVLVARRAIETETAGLAALHATPDEIARMLELLDEQAEVLSLGVSAIEQNTAFHRTLACAGKNRVLIAALDVIYRHPDVMRALEYIRVKVGSTMVKEHRAIVKCVRERDQEGARQAMMEHIGNLIADVDTYWKEWKGR